MVSSERSNSDLSEYTLFQIKKYIFLPIKNQCSGEKKNSVLYAFLSKLLPKFTDFIRKKKERHPLFGKCKIITIRLNDHLQTIAMLCQVHLEILQSINFKLEQIKRD